MYICTCVCYHGNHLIWFGVHFAYTCKTLSHTPVIHVHVYVHVHVHTCRRLYVYMYMYIEHTVYSDDVHVDTVYMYMYMYMYNRRHNINVHRRHSIHVHDVIQCTYLSLANCITWLWIARNDTGESMASRDLAHNRTTLSPVRCIFSVNWSTAMLLGAHTNTCLWEEKDQWIGNI